MLTRNLETRLLKINMKVKITLRNYEYKKLRNEIIKDKRESKKSYYYSYLEKSKLKIVGNLEGISSLVDIKVTKSSSIKLLNENKNLVSNLKIIPNIFNHYFSTIGPEIERKILNVPGSFEDYFNKKDENWQLFINSSNSSFFPFSHCSW